MGKYQFSYEEKITIIREHEENHKTLKAICEEYGISKPLTKPKNLWMNIFIFTTMSEYSSRQDKPQWKSVMLIPHNRCPQKMST